MTRDVQNSGHGGTVPHILVRMATHKKSFREVIRERMAELGIGNANALHVKVKDRGIHRSHLYGYLAGKYDMRGESVAEICDVLDLVLVPRWRVIR